MVLDADGYEPAPPELKLEQVHVYVRHGERTPVGIRLNEPPASIPEHWLLCKAGRKFKAAVWGPHAEMNDVNGMQSLSIQRAVERKDGTSVDDECMLGELTDLGRQSTYFYGQGLRKIYVEKLRFLPDVVSDKGTVYFRSTNMPRTIESLQQVIHGLYPASKFTNGLAPRILVRNPKDENLMANTWACKRLEILNVGFAQAAAELLNETLEPLDKKLSKYLGGNPIRIDGKPRASGVLDTVRSSVAHGVPVPREFLDPTIVGILEHAVVTEWFAGYRNHEFRRLAMGRLLDDLQRKMQKKVDRGDKDPLKILVHSTHDTALAGICSTLDVFDNRWPDFTASVTFELFRKRSSPPTARPSILGSLAPFHKPSGDYFVRMRYQNRTMTLPLCAEKGQHLEGHPEFCTLAAFQARVKELTPDDWERECVPSGRPV